MRTKTEKEIATLKKDLGKFQDEISGVLSDVGQYSQKKFSRPKKKYRRPCRILKISPPIKSIVPIK